MKWLIESAEKQVEEAKAAKSPEEKLERFALLLQLLAQLIAALRHGVSSSEPGPHENRLTIDG